MHVFKVMGEVQYFLNSQGVRVLLEPIGVKGDLRRGINNMQNCPKGDPQRRQESWHFFQGYVRNSKYWDC